MITRYLFVTLITVSLSLGACNTVQKGPSGQLQVNKAAVRADIQQSVPYVRPAAAAACAGVITFGVNPQDRQEIANDVYAVASVVDSLAQGAAPTPDQLKIAIGVGASNTDQYLMIAQAIEATYAAAYPQIKGDPALALQILQQLAAGARDAAAAFSNIRPTPKVQAQAQIQLQSQAPAPSPSP